MEHFYESALSKLRWGSSGEWSASLTPRECAAVLRQLDESAVFQGTVDHRQTNLLSGDPGDEQP